jgi:putative transposase
MPDYRRWFVPGGTYFFTVVTCHRYPFFRDPTARRMLGKAFRDVKSECPFEVFAIVLLWDHLHCLWTLPTGDANYPARWKAIKDQFTSDWLADGGHEEQVTPSQQRRGHRGIWQRRYWEHTIENEKDLERHFDYIHFNPVKHEYVSRAADWPWSSFHRYVASGHYPAEWGREEPGHLAGLDFE